jgi:micrococcal nuclease
MRKTVMRCFFSVMVCFFSTKLAVAKNFETETLITLNGEAAKVRFIDGDTFTILDGPFKQSRVRVTGINSLEVYGPVHQWSTNSPEFFFHISQQSTTLAKKGRWHCSLGQERDGYDRLLAQCDDLALALISAGLAHAYSIDSSSAKEPYLAKQRSAQAAKTGMWKYGKPDFIITSLHSAHEGAERTYNRTISTHDGHSERWYHHDNYATCQKVCLAHEDSCMIYVPFQQRYGTLRPKCLLLRNNS